MIRIFYCTVVMLSSITLVAQKSVALKWKLQPGEVLSYRTVMASIDTEASILPTMSFAKMFGDSLMNDEKQKELLKALSKSFDKSDFVSYLSEKRKGVVGVVISAADNNDTTASDTSNAYIKEIAARMKNVSLRGAVYAEGGVESFYLGTNQLNLLALLFELPRGEVKVGDTWELNVHLTSMDQSFQCDTSFKKNEVRLMTIDNLNGERVATLKYDVKEYSSGEMTGMATMFAAEGSDKTVMDISYDGIARFSIDRGRWVSYEGVMKLNTKGYMASKIAKRFALLAN